MLTHSASQENRSASEQRQALLLQAARTTFLPGDRHTVFQQLVGRSLAELPQPGSGRTLERWRGLCEVAMHDLSLAKLFEGHTDAIAIQRELCPARPIAAGTLWGVWAAEPPEARVRVQRGAGNRVILRGRKSWCSGATIVSHALVTAWDPDGGGPWLVAVGLDQPGVRVTDQGWQAVGMAGSGSVDVEFDGAVGQEVGQLNGYLSRPGFWQGGAGIAACWHGGALALAQTLRQSLAAQKDRAGIPGDCVRSIALGRVDVALQQTAAMLRQAAAWIDQHPQEDAAEVAWRVRLSAEQSAALVLQQVGQALGAGPFCRNAHFARMAADLPVFIRQSGAERDFKALGERVALTGGDSWRL